jgi:hypothetical protein
MKKSFLFLLIFALTIYQHNCKMNQTEVVTAISGILQNFYVANDRRVDILCFECDAKLLNMVNEIAKCHQREKISFRTIATNKTTWGKKKNRFLVNSTIAIFKNVKDYFFFGPITTHKDFLASNYPYHVIYIRDKTKIDDHFKNFYYFNTYLVGNGERKQMTLQTFMIDKKIPMQCPLTKMTTINRIEKTTGQWENNIFFPRKFDDLNGCVYNYGIGNRHNSVHWKQDKSTKAFYVAGPLYEIHRAITDKLNIYAMYYTCESPDVHLELKCLDPSIQQFITAIIDSKYINSKDKWPFVNLQFFDFQYHLGLFIPPGKQ